MIDTNGHKTLRTCLSTSRVTRSSSDMPRGDRRPRQLSHFSRNFSAAVLDPTECVGPKRTTASSMSCTSMAQLAPVAEGSSTSQPASHNLLGHLLSSAQWSNRTRTAYRGEQAAKNNKEIRVGLLNHADREEGSSQQWQHLHLQTEKK